MKRRARRVGMTSKSLFYAIVIHLLVGTLLVMNIDWPTQVVSSRSQPAPVQASVVSEAEVTEQMEAIQRKEQAEQRKAQEAQQKLEELLEQRQREEQRLEEIRQRQKQEQQEAEKLERQKRQEAEELAALKEQQAERRRQEQEQAEAERKAQEEAQEEAERKAQEEAERKRAEKEAAERKRREQAEAERKRKEKEEAERKRQQELAEKRRREEQLQQQLEAERQERRVQSALSQYIPIIRQKVSRNWNRPASVRDSIEALVAVRLSQAGEVLSARIVQSSGNSVFDRSVENAVLKASPLPIPQEPGVNEKFRTLNLRFRPEDMVS